MAIFLLTYVIFCVVKSASSSPCQVLNSDFPEFCTCLGLVAECEHLVLNKMPLFRTGHYGLLKMELSHNQIKMWPNSSYWQIFKNLEVVTIYDNPICMLDKSIPETIKIYLTECSSEYKHNYFY